MIELDLKSIPDRVGSDIVFFQNLPNGQYKTLRWRMFKISKEERDAINLVSKLLKTFQEYKNDN